MGEDINAVSPTLGFIIKTIDYEGYLLQHRHCSDQDSGLTKNRYKLNICEHCPRQTSLKVPMKLIASGDVGGQKTLRSYWRNYFEKTDALIWVVDATDRLRIEDCREELHGLLQEEVRPCLLKKATHDSERD